MRDLHAHAKRGLLIEWGSWSDGAWSLEERSPFSLETCMPAVFAAGDVCQGSMDRVASAVGEGSTAIKLIHELFAAEQIESGDPV